MNNRLPILIILFISISSFAQNKPGVWRFDLSKIATYDQVHLKIVEKGDRKWMEFRADTLRTFFNIPGVSDGYAWAEAKYLVLEVENRESQNISIDLDFFDKAYETSPIRKVQVSIFPGIRSQVVIPLSVLQEETENLARFPGQLKGKMSGLPIKQSEVQRVGVSISPLFKPDRLARMGVFFLALVKEIPGLHQATVVPVVDSLGQWIQKSWPEKTKTVRQMNLRLSDELRKKSIDFQTVDSKKPIIKTGTGFFTTHHDGKRWWLLDPAGKPFQVSGINQVRPIIAGPIAGLEALHSYIPNPKTDGKNSFFYLGPRLQMNYLATNFQRALGDNWVEKWQGLCTKSIRNHRFNCLGPGSETELISQSHLPYFIQLSRFPKSQESIFLDFPDVFDPAFSDSILDFGSQIKKYDHDNLLIGYFLGSQPKWSVGDNNLAAEMLKSGKNSYSRTELNQWLRKRYQGQIIKLNTAWKESFLDFEAIDSAKNFIAGPKASADLMAFSEIMIDSLITRICRKLKQNDPYHLNFGFRFSSISQDIWYRTFAGFDVFSLVVTDLQLPATTHITERSGRPVLICDYQLGALDKGLPSGGPAATNNTADRAKTIRSVMEEAFYREEVVGFLHGSFYDRPVLGKMDGENYQVGLLDVCHKPYEAVWSEMKKANRNQFKLATHQFRPFFRLVEPAELSDN